MIFETVIPIPSKSITFIHRSDTEWDYGRSAKGLN
jgi:hypothetical protein